MTEETWKTHPTTGLIVSDRGRVLIPKNGKNTEHITYGSERKGYKKIQFKKKQYSVHRLIAETFVPNPDNLPCVNHKDENKSNNCADNLEWCTHQYNINYGTCIQRMTEKLRNVPNRSKPVYQYDKQGNLVNTFPSTAECGRNGFDHGAVSQCCNGVRKTYKGYIWSYIERT